MNTFTEFSLKALHKIYVKLFTNDTFWCKRPWNPDDTSAVIYEKLTSEKKCMVARMGSVELLILINYLGITQHKEQYLNYLTNKTPQWWWNKKSVRETFTNAGIFPNTTEVVTQFCELMLPLLHEVDVLGSWMNKERYFDHYWHTAQKVHLFSLEPYWSQQPWTRALAGKKVLVIHPFTNSIQQQYHNKRHLLFKNPDVLPEFEQLHTIKAVQSIAGGMGHEFKDWFSALNWMKAEMDSIDYDIALIGCGAYGFPLAAHAKQQGKKAIHLGGALQLLFGIKGGRWKDPNYAADLRAYGVDYQKLFNEHWISPSRSEQIPSMQNVENACYW